MKSNKPQMRKGHCENYFNCTLADDHVIQEIAPGDDFKCKNSSCRHDLVEELPTPKPKWIWFVLGAAVIVITILLIPKDCTRTIVNEFGDTIITKGTDTITIKYHIDTIVNEFGDTIITKGTDTITIKYHIDTIVNNSGDTIITKGPDTIKVIKNKGPEVKPPITPPQPPQQQPLPPYGKYSGPRNSDGEPHGKGGNVIITVSYYVPGVFRTFEPGDKIKNTTYENGNLKHGRVIKTTGEEFDF